MTIEDIGRLTHQVLWAAFLVSAVFGAIVQRTGFCTMGAITDAVAVGDWTRLRQWGLAAGLAMAGFAGLTALGVLGASQTLYASTRWMWLSAAVGGALFGFGMVIASGCGSKNLVRVGGGNLKALVVVLVLGLSAFMTLKGLTAVIRNATVDRVAVEMAGDASLGAWIARAAGTSPSATAALAGLVLGLLLVAWGLSSPDNRRPLALLGGAGVAVTVLAMWWITGGLGHVAEHPETLQDTFLATNTGRAEALSFVSPVAYGLDWLMFFSDANKRLTVGIVSVAGVIAGSAVLAISRRTFRWEGFANASDLAHHLVGAVLMGVGGVTAMGCTIGQGISGLSTLSLTSFVAVGAIVAGGWLGVKYQLRRIEREA